MKTTDSKIEIIKSIKAGIKNAREMGNADCLIYLQDELVRLEAEGKEPSKK